MQEMRKPIPLAVTLTENISVPARLNATAATIVLARRCRA